MNTTRSRTLITISLALTGLLCAALAEPGDKLVPGDAFPSYQLRTTEGKAIESPVNTDKVRVIIYVIAKQRGSERAIADASKIFDDFDEQDVELIFVSAGSEESEYFQRFWKEKHINGTLAFDPDRKLYAQLGLIAFPSTLIINAEGKLVHALSTHSPNYPHVLDGYIRHSLGLIDDSGLEEHLKARSLPTSSPKSIASRHRAVARLMKEKGLLDTAEKELLEALTHDHESLEIRLDLAELCLHLDRLDEASHYIDQVKQVDPENRHGLLLKGILLYQQSNYDEAQQVLSEALVLNPDPARTHYYLGRIYEAVGSKDQSIYHYRQALSRLLDEPAE